MDNSLRLEIVFVGWDADAGFVCFLCAGACGSIFHAGDRGDGHFPA